MKHFRCRLAILTLASMFAALGASCRGVQINQLEKRVAQLETRVAVLESQVGSQAHK